MSPRSGGATTATELAKSRCTSSGSSHQHHDEGNEKSFFLLFFSSLQIPFSLDYTHQKNQSSSFNQSVFSVLQSQINTLRKTTPKFIILPLLPRDEIDSSRFFRYSHTPNFFLFSTTSSSRDIQQEESKKKYLAMTNLFCNANTHTRRHV